MSETRSMWNSWRRIATEKYNMISHRHPLIDDWAAAGTNLFSKPLPYPKTAPYERTGSHAEDGRMDNLSKICGLDYGLGNGQPDETNHGGPAGHAGDRVRAIAPMLAAVPGVRVAILVMGVGRSGTSVLTHLISQLGAALPKTLLGPGKGNERGHWEPARLIALNDEILRVHGGNWWTPKSIPAQWYSTPLARDFVSDAAEIIGDEFGDAPLFVLKDPRICRLAPLYFDALAQLGIEPRIILPLRHPSEVVRSVVARDGTDPRAVERIWMRDLLDAEALSRDRARVWTSYTSLLADWRTTVAKIGNALHLCWPNRPESLSAEIEALIDPGLRHFDADQDSEPMDLDPLTARLWQAAQRGLAGDETAMRVEFDAIRAIMDRSERFAASMVSPQASELPWTGERLVPSLSGDIVLEHLHRYALAAELVDGKDVLDIASGEGYGTNLLAARARSAIGVDISDEAVWHARGKYPRANLGFRLGTCTAIPLPDWSVDVVVSFETLEHFVEQEKFIDEVRRVLRPGGVFVVSSPDQAVYSGRLGNRNPFHPRELDAAEFETLLRGRFTHVALLNQRVAMGSYVAAMGRGALVAAGTHRGGFDTMNFAPGAAEGVYLIGVASDAPLPPLRVGLFEFGHEEEGRFLTPLMVERAACEAARREGESAQACAGHLRSELANERAAVAALLETIARDRVEQLRSELASERAKVAAMRETIASAERWQRSWFKRAFHRWRPKRMMNAAVPQGAPDAP